MSTTSGPTFNIAPHLGVHDKASNTQEQDSSKICVSMTVNGHARMITVEPRMTLLTAMRDELGLTGTKLSCDRGECGACTVHVDGRRILDPVLGRFLNRNFSGYLIPTNADIPKLDVLFVGDLDEEASPLGTKGMGELTAVSVAPAIANAEYHATGKRVRRLPITVESVL
jgi:2Fe-2S iron-sulfur cluster binding domain